jgi:hypothetical protein
MPIIGTIASSRLTQINYTSGYYTISSGNPSGSSNTFTISSIPNTYTHLQLRISARSDYAPWGGGSWFMYVNNDTTSNIYNRSGFGMNDGSSLGGGSSLTNRADLSYIPMGGTNSTVYGSYVVDFYNYTSTTKGKSISVFGAGYKENLNVTTFYYNSTNPISSLVFTTIDIGDGNQSRGNFMANSVFSLYGWKDS